MQFYQSKSKQELLQVLFSSEAFNTLFSAKSNTIKITQLNAAIALLIKLNLDFFVDFFPGTSGTRPSVELTVNLTPSTAFEFTLTLNCNG